MNSSTEPIQTELVLVGGGHANIQVLKSFGMRPIAGLRVSLISDVINAPYSGMLPGFVAGEYSYDEMHINLVQLANFANARFIKTNITSIDTLNRQIHCEGRPEISYDLISVNTGITPDFGDIIGAREHCIAVKPISHFLSHLPNLDATVTSPTDVIAIIGSGAAGIELAFAFRARFNQKNIKPKITIIGSAERFFPTLPKKCHQAIYEQCKKADIEVHLGHAATQVSNKVVTLNSGVQLAASHTFLVTGAKPSEWLNSSSIDLTSDGYIEVNNAYQSISNNRVFAGGDIAKIKHQPRPRSGVFAVRAGPILAKNLRLALEGMAVQPHQPQSRYLSLIMLGNGTVMALWDRFYISAKWLWPVKKWIDQKFISNFSNLPDMKESTHSSIKLSEKELMAEKDPLLEKMHCAGCGAKAGAHLLDTVLPIAAEIAAKLGGDMRYLPNLNIIADAGEFPIAEFSDSNQTMVQTIDSISQMISDPFLFGRIAALHSLSDLVVSNTVPLTALSLITLQRAKRNLQESDLTNMLAGAMIEFSRAKVTLIGGHTSQSYENSLGFALTGIKNKSTHSKAYLPSFASNLEPLSVILTKPLGIGLLLAASMRNEAPDGAYQNCVDVMLASNTSAAEFLWQNGVLAMTDVTGFGLARHIENVIQDIETNLNVKMGAALFLHKIPILEGASKILENTSIRASLSPSNKNSVRNFMDLNTKNTSLTDILFDPQTSGGIVAVVPTANANKLVAHLQKSIAPKTAIIGSLLFEHTGITAN